MLSDLLLILDTSDKKSFFEELLNEYSRLMQKTARQYTNDAYVVDDIVQDSIVRLIRHVEKIMTLPRCNLAGYIVITVKNTAYDHLKQKTLSIEETNGVIDAATGEDSSVEQIVLRLDERANFLSTWSHLQVEDRIILEKKYVLGESDAEIASELGCKESSIRMKLTRARRRAAKLFREEQECHDETRGAF